MTDWKKKSAMAILAGGLFGTTEAQAQPIGTNLVANPSFEQLLGNGNVASWTGTALGTYAYSQAYTSIIVPPSSGLLYLHGPFAASADTRQSINLVAAGFPAAMIDAGITFDLSAFFSTYMDTNDFATITAEFRDAGNALIATSSPIGGEAFVDSLPVSNNLLGMPGFNDWGMNATTGVVPAGTRSVDINILHTRLAGTACDSYTDNVNFQITAIPAPSTLLLATIGGATILGGHRRRRPDEKKS